MKFHRCYPPLEENLPTAMSQLTANQRVHLPD